MQVSCKIYISSVVWLNVLHNKLLCAVYILSHLQNEFLSKYKYVLQTSKTFSLVSVLFLCLY